MLSAIVFLPLLGALIAGLGGRVIGARGAEIVTTGFLFMAFGLSIAAFSRIALGGEVVTVEVLPWIQSGSFQASWSLRFDTLTAVMLIVVNGVSALVHMYSIGYMHEDPGRPRFFAYLSLFTFAMLMLVTADNFLQLFFGWEGVGLASYLLIGFWYEKPSANAAAIKAFIVNRVGDFGFALGIMGVYFAFGSISFDTVFAAAPDAAGQSFDFLGYRVDILTTICLLLFMGACGKSAQLGLHTWLPDAMEGPTPVSALIHAATMVTAGVFLVCRCSPLFEFAPTALMVVTVVGASTAFFAATVGLFQNDIKRVIAYSTCSQLGYMFFAAGISAYEAAMFHLFTHAFFKALLFLGAGSVIHAMHHEQDLRRMGGLFRLIPLTWAMMLIGTFALTGLGIPFLGIGTSGFYSKDVIIEAAYASGTEYGMYAFIVGVVAAVMTAFYSWRLIFMAFHGPHRADEETIAHVHESPSVMTVPLMALALGAVFAGGLFANLFVGEERAAFWNGSIYVAAAADGAHAAAAETHGAADHAPAAVDAHGAAPAAEATAPEAGAAHHGAGVLDAAHNVPNWVKLSPFAAMALGFAIAWYFYIRHPAWPPQLAARKGPLYTFLYNKWYFDELYEFLFVVPAKWIGRLLWKTGDGAIIDGLGPDGVAARVVDVTRRVVQLQSGFIYHYAFAMLIGIAALVTYFMASGGVQP